MPLLSTQLESITTELCDQNRTYLTEEWLSKCCELLVEHADAWKHLVPLSANNPSYKQVSIDKSCSRVNLQDIPQYNTRAHNLA
jgi:hypothetical protein